MPYVEIDGSQGEGGGQILRTAMAFSAIQRKPIRVSKIRAGREVPGLKRQHVSALEVVAEVFGGELWGASEGSTQIEFSPGSPRVTNISADMKTAASITLVLQAVVPAVALSGSRLALTLTGGTDVPWSPTLDYLDIVVRSAFAEAGIRFLAVAERRGYYPKGGGRVNVEIEPSRDLRPVNFVGPPATGTVNLVSRCALLPKDVAERQLTSAAAVIESGGFSLGNRSSTTETASSPGSSILVSLVGKRTFLGGDAIGSRGRPAEDVGKEAASRFLEAARSGACLDLHVADMLLPLLSLASGTSRVRVSRVTPHLEAGLALARQFTSCSYTISGGADKLVTITPPPAN